MKIFYSILVMILFLFYGCESTVLSDPSLSINYLVKEKSNVKVTLENSYNTEIAILVNRVQDAGVYRVTYNESGLVSGIYFCIIELKGLETGSYEKQTKQLLLIK